MSTITEEGSADERLFGLVHRSSLSNRTKALYAGHLNDFLLIAGGRPAEWQERDISVYRDWLLTRDLQPSSVNVALHAVRFFLRRAAQEFEIPDLSHHAEPVSMPRLRAIDRPSLTLEQARELVRACEGRTPIDLRDRAICVVGLRTGMRRFSLVRLRWPLDFARCEVPIGAGRFHYISLDEETIGVLEPWLAWLALQDRNSSDGFLFRGMSRERVDGTRRVSLSITDDGLYGALAIRADSAGIRDFSLKHLSATYVALAIQYGVPAETIAAMTGRSVYEFRSIPEGPGVIPSLLSGGDQ